MAGVATLPRWDEPSEVSHLVRDYPDGAHVGSHCHGRAQLVHAVAGVMEIAAGRDLWIVPPQRALWIPPRTAHALRARGPVALRTLYVPAHLEPADRPSGIAALAVTPLLRALVLRAMALPADYDAQGPDGRLVAVLLDEVARSPAEPLRLPMPTDPRLARLCRHVLAHPGDRRDLRALARAAGASERTLRRLAGRELGMPFSLWRQQARILAALPSLAAGRPVTETAHALGYETASAFAAMFRLVLGTAPRRYFHERQ